jgi:hypothetical protein
MIPRSSICLPAGGVQLIIFIIVLETRFHHIRHLGNFRLRHLGERRTIVLGSLSSSEWIGNRHGTPVGGERMG